MGERKEASEVFKLLENHEQRIRALEDKKKIKPTYKINAWYQSGSTIEKIILFIEKGFFDVPRSIKEISLELKTKDYHFSASDLTLPLRRIVRKEILKRTKKKSDGSASKSWLYVKT